MKTELNTLAGKRMFSGIDRKTIEKKTYGEYTEQVECVLFILDGVTYRGVEDPNDGYRSSMDALEVSEDAVSNVFPPKEVLCKHRDKNRYSGEDDVLEIYNMNGGLILEIGTSNIDDYYPSFVCNFSAEELSK